MIITKPNSFGGQIQRSIAIELIIRLRTMIEPPQNLLSILTCPTRMHRPKLIPSHYTPSQGFRQALSSQATLLREKPCKSKGQIHRWMKRVIGSAEERTVPIHTLSRLLFGRVLAPLEPGSRAVWLELNQGSRRRRYCNLSMWFIKLVRRIGENLVPGFGGRNRSKGGRVTWIRSGG